jgi:hypothetical protein
VIVVSLASSPLGSTFTASSLPHPRKPTGQSSGRQLGDNEDVGFAAGECGGGGSGLAPWGPRTVAAPVDSALKVCRLIVAPSHPDRFAAAVPIVLPPTPPQAICGFVHVCYPPFDVPINVVNNSNWHINGGAGW